MANPVLEVQELGQSIWQDDIRRGFITSGELQELVDEGLLGITSNPSIFEKAIAGSADYDADFRALVARGTTDPGAIYEHLALDDIRAAARLLEPAYRRTDARDGYVSFEVSPHLAHDTEGTVREALRLFAAIGRPNVMIKVPGTPEGVPAIERLVAEGVNVNVTLLFAIEAYQRAAEAYLRGLETLMARGRDASRVASVASFFLSRIDTLVDERLASLIERTSDPSRRATLEVLLGRTAIANAKVAYARYRELIGSPRWKALAARGARPQRLLWASTSTKNPRYPKLMYAEALIGPDTVDTLPRETFREFLAHGRARRTLDEGIEQAARTLDALTAAGISLEDETALLLAQGVEKFARSFDDLIRAIEHKRDRLLGGRVSAQRTALGAAEGAVRAAMERWRDEGRVRRLWKRDPTLWTGGDEARWLGWLDAVDAQADHLEPFERIAAEVRDAGFRRVLLLGMGGSSLFPWVLARTFGKQDGFPDLEVLDSTVPSQIRAAEAACDPERTLFVVTSKSGTTVEPLALERHFIARVRSVGLPDPGSRFVAITDPGSPLQALAERERFRRIFAGEPSIGGRYAALSPVGLVPAALMGLDVAALLHSAEIMVQACASCVPPEANPGVSLGLVLGTLAARGIDKVTFVPSRSVRALGAWLEQLLAESTGKDGKGLVPVDGERLGPPEAYGRDRVFVHLRERSTASAEEDALVAALEAAGHPIVGIDLEDPVEIVQEVFRWEMATAVAGSLLGIDPFDQPDVEGSKETARRLLRELEQGGRWHEKRPIAAGDGLALYADPRNASELEDRVRGATPEALLAAHLSRLGPGDYFAVHAYLEMSAENEEALGELRTSVRDARRVATTVGFGPRFLHSTGQLHKGGPATGLFLQITADERDNVPVPGERHGFAELVGAQARGDFEELARRGRRLLRVHVGPDVPAGLAALNAIVRRALS